MSERIYGLFIFGICFNVLFGVFGYAFTMFPEQPASLYNGTLPLDIDTLIKEGIYLNNATVFNVSWMEPWHEFTHGNVEARAGFREGTILGRIRDGVRIQGKRVGLETYHLAYEYPFSWGEYYESSQQLRNLSNDTIVNYYEPEHNWTRFKAGEFLIGFVIPRPEHNGDINQAVTVDGNLTIVLGEYKSFTEADDLRSFLSWYWTALFTFNTAYVPVRISIFLKLILSLTMVAGLIVAREQLPI